MNAARPVIIDCDPGIDDALALMLAVGAAPLRLEGVSCVAGNRPLAQTVRNACGLLDVAGCPGVPVFAGCERPMARAQPRSNRVHGDDGLGGLALPSTRHPETTHAVEFLSRALQQSPAGTITLIALGPLTNLAMAEILHPGVLRRARQVLVMGGAAFRRGNATPHAEFNFHADALAAHVVLQAGAALTLFTLDVTEQAVVTPEWKESLAGLPSHCARLAHAMFRGYATVEPVLHDPCPVAYAIDPTLYECEPFDLSVEWCPGPNEGRLQAVRPPDATACASRLARRVEADRLLWLVRERLQALP